MFVLLTRASHLRHHGSTFFFGHVLHRAKLRNQLLLLCDLCLDQLLALRLQLCNSQFGGLHPTPSTPGIYQLPSLRACAYICLPSATPTTSACSGLRRLAAWNSGWWQRLSSASTFYYSPSSTAFRRFEIVMSPIQLYEWVSEGWIRMI